MFPRDLSCLVRLLLTILGINIVIIIVSVSFIRLYEPSDRDFCESYKVNGSWPVWSYNLHNVSTKYQQELYTVSDVLTSNLTGRYVSASTRTTSSYSKCDERQNISERGHTKLYCDKDCRRFRRLLHSWPPGRPKAVIYFLIHVNETNLVEALRRLDSFFNDEFRYPVVIFVGQELKTDPVRKRILSATESMIFFQTVTFNLPPYNGELEIPDIVCSKSIGYRHMCRFQAKGVYEQPILEGVEYTWRLDDDSEILAPIRYDVFEFMRSRNLTYGYYAQITDSAVCVAYLWETTCRYVSEEHIKTEYFSQWKPTYMYYNNFEISALSLWRSCAYQHYINYIDRLGGIYYFRWGDAPIKSIALSLFTPKNQVHHFNDIAYRHQGLVS